MSRSYVEKYQGIYNGNVASTSTGSGTLVVTGGIGTSGRVSANDVVISATTASTNTSTGALTISGGVGVGGNVYVGGNTASTSTSTGALVVTGGVGVSGRVTSDNVSTGALAASGAVTMTQGTASTSTGSGTLVVTGGVGVSGSINARGFGIGGYRTAGVWAGPISIVTNPTMKLGSRGEIGGYNGDDWTNATSASTSTDTGTLVVEGGVGISGCLNIGGYVTNTVLANGSTVGNTSFGVGQSSTSTSTGTLVVTGGVGVSGNINASKFTSGPLNIKNSDIFSDHQVPASGINLVPGENGSVTIAPDAFNELAEDTYEGGSGVLTNANPTHSTSTSSGALIVIGGVGISGNLNVGGSFSVGTLNSTDLTVTGNLIVNGTTTTINSSTITVDDKNIELGSVSAASISATGTVGSITGSGPWNCTVSNMTSTKGLIEGSIVQANNGTGSLHGPDMAGVVTGILSPTSISVLVTLGDAPTNGTITNITTLGATDSTANGGGITLRGATNKTITWDSTNSNWTSSEHWNIASGKAFKINNTNVLTSTQLGSAITFSSNTASTSTSTGTLVVTGGVGVSGVIHCKGIKSNKLNPGVTLILGATSTSKVSIKFPIDFKSVSESSMFQVPSNHMFLIDSMEVITTLISDAGTPPTVRLGNTSVANAYYGPTQITSNSVGARHIIENPQNGVTGGTTVTCGVTVASTATSHNGFIKVSGELIDLNDLDAFFDGVGIYQDS